MELCVFVGPNFGATYDDLSAVARHAEELGFAGYFVSDHYTAWAGDGLPGPTDAWVTLAGLALQTRTIRLGTLVTAVTFRHVGALAIAVAQVDAMSGGRVELGIGAGWLAAEHAAYGIPFPSLRERFDLLEEGLEVISGLWATPVGERFDFQGKLLQVVDSPALPKPAQRPGPPIIVGGGGKVRTPGLAARYAREFNLPWPNLEDVAPLVARVRQACEDVGRDPASMAFSASLHLGAGKTDAQAKARVDLGLYKLSEAPGGFVAGSPTLLVDVLGGYAELGVKRVYVRNPPWPGSNAENLELIAAEVLPQVRGL